ncbi:hypothetical protein ROP_30800 [Rhodococcus opacus B4]|uniref:Uncharacterized protein n=1 Tax=Rhodococcus opacus (strain B4) TaxID=632772 RepID=C1B6M4_RHOOB|nr:hypothetical protein ROP_30800 [Rhodococcus opacus B4]
MGRSTVVGCGGIDCPDSPVAWIERFLSEVGVTVEALREVGWQTVGNGGDR